MVVLAPLDQRIVNGRGNTAAIYALAPRIADVETVGLQDAPVALLQIGHVPGERGERNRVRTEEHFTFAIPQHERAATPGPHQQALFAGEDDRQRECAVKFLQGRLEGIDRIQTFGDLLVEQLGDDFRIGFRFERASAGLQRVAQLAEVLDNAVVDDGHAARHVGVGIGFIRFAVRRPARMGNARRPIHRTLTQQRLKIHDLARSAAAFDPAGCRDGDASAVIPAILKPLQAIDQTPCHGRIS